MKNEDPYENCLKPRIGSIVLYRAPKNAPVYFRGVDQLPAIVTRVRSIQDVDLAVITRSQGGLPIVHIDNVNIGDGPHQWMFADIPQSTNPLLVQK